MSIKHKRVLAGAVAAVMTLSAVPMAGAARLNELQYAPDKGITDTINYVDQLDSLKRVLFIGAHPDDETNSLLVYLNRQEGAILSIRPSTGARAATTRLATSCMVHSVFCVRRN